MASTEAPTTRGLDAKALWEWLAQPWRELHRVPPMVWLAPLPAVEVLHADGVEALWLGDQRQVSTERQRAAAPFVALELPRTEHLEISVRQPAMAHALRQSALAMEVRLASPFDPADLTWGWRESPHQPDAFTVLMASRRAVQAQLEARAAKLAGRGPVEVWAFDEAGRPVVLQGYGEEARRRHTERGRLIVWLLLSLALLLMVAVAVTPTVQLKLRAMQAVRAHAEIQARLGPVVAQREALVKQQGQRDALAELMAERIEPLAVLDLITQAVPDDTWVQRLQARGSKLVVSGPTPNTAALMNRLSGLSQISEVKSPTAATRAPGGREQYTVEMTLLPAALRPVLSGRTAAASAPAPAVTPASAPSAASETAPQQQKTMAPPAATASAPTPGNATASPAAPAPAERVAAPVAPVPRPAAPKAASGPFKGFGSVANQSGAAP